MRTDFDPFIRRLTTVVVECLDFRDLIGRYNCLCDRVLFYCDPPYWVANKTNYYKRVFGQQDHQDLRLYCDAIHKQGHRFLVSYDDIPEIVDLYGGYYLYRTDPLLYSAGAEYEVRHNEKAELVIANYDIADLTWRRQAGLEDTDRDEKDQYICIAGHPGLRRVS